MSSVRRIQTERVLERTLRSLFGEGEKPMTSQITQALGQYFSKFPAGLPLPLPKDGLVTSAKSNVDEFNQMVENLEENLDVLFEASHRQIDNLLTLTSVLDAELKRLRTKRRQVSRRIDDYLLTSNNARGYYYAASDGFETLDKIDLSYTSAQIDTVSGIASLPFVPTGVFKLTENSYGVPQIKAIHRDGGESLKVETLSPFSGAVEDDLENLFWAVEVTTSSEIPVQLEAIIEITESVEPTRFEFTPYGTQPVRLLVETRSASGEYSSFGNKIVTSAQKMVFVDNPNPTSFMRLRLDKSKSDYTELVDGALKYKYIFGARAISTSRVSYDTAARLVSAPLTIPEDLQGEVVIDAVSLEVEQEVPQGCSVEYFVAPDTGSETGLEDFDWQAIVPFDSNEESGMRLVRFEGARPIVQSFAQNPEGGEEQLPERTLNPTIIPGLDLYQIGTVPDGAITNSLSLLEGVNTVKVLSKLADLGPDFGNFDDVDLTHWADFIESDAVETDYFRIDRNNDFFAGAVVGAVGQDVYIETYLETKVEYETFLSNLQKLGDRALGWDIKIYLNGRLLARAKPGVDSVQIPWSFNLGLNHIVALVRIPTGGSDFYLGSFDLMSGRDLFDFGEVHLGKWSHVDQFTLTYNQTGQPRTYTTVNEKLVTRRKPTDNFRLRYAIATNNDVNALRIRADIQRPTGASTLTPTLDSYRIRFSYGDNDV